MAGWSWADRPRADRLWAGRPWVGSSRGGVVTEKGSVNSGAGARVRAESVSRRSAAVSERPGGPAGAGAVPADGASAEGGATRSGSTGAPGGSGASSGSAASGSPRASGSSGGAAAAGATVAPPSQPGTPSASSSGQVRRGRDGRRGPRSRRTAARHPGDAAGWAGPAGVRRRARSHGGLGPATPAGRRPARARRPWPARPRRRRTPRPARRAGRRPPRRRVPRFATARLRASMLHHSGIPRGGTGEVAAYRRLRVTAAGGPTGAGPPRR
jgi:hypothetical protein